MSKCYKILNFSISHCELLESEINSYLEDQWKVERIDLVHDKVADKTTGYIVWLVKEIEKEQLCSSYHVDSGIPRCYGTKEMDQCSCDGDKNKCDFY